MSFHRKQQDKQRRAKKFANRKQHLAPNNDRQQVKQKLKKVA